MLVFFRKKLGLTQVELAAKAGYSTRLVSKAESGKSIAVSTLEDLAEALSTETEPVFYEDLCCNPLSMAREFIRALYLSGPNAIDATRHFIDKNVEFCIAGDPEKIPFAGQHCGIEAVDAAIRCWFSGMQGPENHDIDAFYRYFSQGNEVVVWGDSWLHPIGQPLETPMPVSCLFRFFGGRLVYFEDRFNTD
jgi:transcriptional regulator with XRE-family HTH domain